MGTTYDADGKISSNETAEDDGLDPFTLAEDEAVHDDTPPYDPAYDEPDPALVGERLPGMISVVAAFTTDIGGSRIEARAGAERRYRDVTFHRSLAVLIAAEEARSEGWTVHHATAIVDLPEWAGVRVTLSVSA